MMATRDSKRPPDVTIGITGPTGAGKSSFIRLITGDKNVEIGHGVQSMTSEIGRYNWFTEGGRCVTLVDTPGFDDSREEITDTDILQRIASFLDVEFKRGKKLSGIIYLHRITDPRMGGTSNRNLKMFQKLCGEMALKNVTVVTTRWDDVQDKDREATERREEELMKTKGMFFEPIIAAGGRFLRHDNTIKSARKIMDQLVDNEPMTLQIQIEMRDGKKVEETAAGIELRAEMNRLIERHTNEMKDLIEEMKEATAEKDEELRKELEAEQARMRKDMEKWEAEKKQLEGDLDSVTQAAVVAQEEAERQTGRQRDEYLRKVRGTEEKQKGPADRRMSRDGDDTGRRLEKPEYSKGTVDWNNQALEEERQRNEYLRKVREADEKAERERKERKEAMDRASRGKDHTSHRLEYPKNMMGGNNRALEVERQIRRQTDESLCRVREAEEKAARERKEAMDRASRQNDNTSHRFEKPESSKNTVDGSNRAIDRHCDEYCWRREAEEKAEREKKEEANRVSREKEDASRRLRDLENTKNTLDRDNRAFQAQIQAQIDEARREKEKVERKHRRLLRNIPRSWFR